MTQTVDIMHGSDVRRIGTEALLKALGPLGMAQYLESFDDGGHGDYTREKYEEPDITMEEFKRLRDSL